MRRAAYLAAGVALFALTGCMGSNDGQSGEAYEAAPTQGLNAANTQGSPLITSLQARRSVLPEGSSFDQVADAVMAANSRAAEAELRAAVLRSSAAQKNWLPQIGPEISLDNMGDFVATLLVEQVIFDNGRKKAERAYAAADVEVAAASLSESSNQRVMDALKLFITAEKARARAKISGQAAADMADFMRIMEARVAGGVSDSSDENVLRLKLNEARETLNADMETAATALAELNAMAAYPLDDLRGISDIAPVPEGTEPLSVMSAEGERSRTIAEAKIERAGLLPSLTASGAANKDDSSGALVFGGGMLGLGTADSLGAADASQQAAEAQIQQAYEDTARVVARLQQQLASLDRQQQNTGTLAAQAKRNYTLFQEQYEAGQRQVMDVVNVYEGMVDSQLEHVGLRYDAILTRLSIANEYGLLVNGDAV